MKQNNLILSLVFILSGCVQKTYTKTVVFTLTVPAAYHGKNIGIRGDDAPLSWTKNLEMKAANNDSTFTVPVTFITGYTYTSVKFVVNDEFELAGSDNRKVVFSNTSDTTFYSAQFNKNPSN